MLHVLNSIQLVFFFSEIKRSYILSFTVGLLCCIYVWWGIQLTKQGVCTALKMQTPHLFSKRNTTGGPMDCGISRKGYYTVIYRRPHGWDAPYMVVEVGVAIRLRWITRLWERESESVSVSVNIGEVAELVSPLCNLEAVTCNAEAS